MKIKIQIIASILLLAVGLLNAQNSRRFYGGFKLGLNMAQIDGDGLFGYNRFGIQTGIMGAAYLGNKTELQIEFLYGTRGSKYSTRSNLILAYKLNYIDVPFILSFKDWFYESTRSKYFKLHFQGGFYLGRLISSTSIDQAMLDKSFKKIDFGWLLGFTYYSNVHWGFTGRFTNSVTPLLRYVNSQGEDIRMISYFISLGLTYRFN